MFDRDPELPAGFQDADLEMAGLQRSANREARIEAAGTCCHGWYGTDPGTGRTICRKCKTTFDTEAELLEARKEALL